MKKSLIALLVAGALAIPAFAQQTTSTTPAQGTTQAAPAPTKADAATGKTEMLKTLPAKFDASKQVVEQLWATSKDGVKIPYFVVRPKDLKSDGTAPTLLTAYGGFQVSSTPSYAATAGKLE